VVAVGRGRPAEDLAAPQNKDTKVEEKEGGGGDDNKEGK